MSWEILLGDPGSPKLRGGLSWKLNDLCVWFRVIGVHPGSSSAVEYDEEDAYWNVKIGRN